jgi:GTP cyclohydrolase II
MVKLLQLLTQVTTRANLKLITNEVKTRKGNAIVSKTFLNILHEYYPNTSDCHALKTCFLKVWESEVKVNYTEAQWKELFNAVDKIAKAVFKKETTLSQFYVALRKPVKKRFPNGPVFRMSEHEMGLGQERSIQKKDKEKKKRDKRVGDRGKKKTFDAGYLYTLIDKNIEHKDGHMRAIAVILATGSRFIEVYKKSLYTTPTEHEKKTNQLDDLTIKVDNVAKKREQTTHIFKQVIRTTPDKVIAAVEYIRNEFKTAGMTDDNVRSKYNGRINERITKLFKAREDEIKSHKLRALYANMAFQLYGQKAKIPELTYIQDVLGHTSTETAAHYATVWVSFPDEAKLPRDVVVKLGEAQHDVVNNRDQIAQLKEQIQALAPVAQENLELRNSRKLSKDEKLRRLGLLKDVFEENGGKATNGKYRSYGYGAAIIKAFKEQ